jgi:hypothetical protein
MVADVTNMQPLEIWWTIDLVFGEHCCNSYHLKRGVQLQPIQRTRATFRL